MFGRLRAVEKQFEDLEDPTGVDAWEAIVRDMPPLSEEEQKRLEEFIAEIRQPLAPGDPRRHHFLARFYLRRFADADERLMVVPLDKSLNTGLRHIDNVAVRRDFYTHIDEDVGETVAVEKILSVIEGNVAEVFRALDDGIRPFPMSSEHQGHLATFIAFQLVRDPFARRRMEAMSDQLFKMDATLVRSHDGARARLRQNLGREPSDKEVADVVEQVNAISDDVEFVRHQNDYIKMMMDGAMAMFPHVLRRTFSVMHFPEPGLVLSDQPVILHQSRPQPDLGVGVLTADEIWLPLDRRNVLIMHHRPPSSASGVANAPSMLRDTFNEAVMWSAASEIYCHPDDLHIVQSAQLPEPNRPLFGMAGGSWLVAQTDGVNAAPRRTRVRRYRGADTS